MFEYARGMNPLGPNIGEVIKIRQKEECVKGEEKVSYPVSLHFPTPFLFQ